MTPQEFKDIIRKNKEQLKRAISRTIPVKVATTAQHHFRDNFRKSGFDGGMRPWQRSKRQNDPKHPDRNYKTLMSRRERLYRSISKKTEPAKAIVYTEVPYAKAHNEGTNNAGRNHNVHIPKRQFMGESRTLHQKCLDVINQELQKILNNR